MMLSTDLHEAAVEFGQALRRAPAVAAYRAAADAFGADVPAQLLMADLREHQESLARTQRTGLTPSREQIDRLRLCQAAVRGSTAIMAHLQATNDVKAFLPAVALEVSAALGTDYASLVAPGSC
jgi:cell fate (sporulation/competence/biofilm development) regulator YlbF (YheA/YmcA/DUF963 family)